MANNDNLIPAKPGEIRNPNGKPKGTKNRSTLVRELLEARLDENHTYAQAMTKAVMEKALSGDVGAWDKLFDSAFGKVTDKQEVDLKADVNSSDLTNKVLGSMTKEQLEALLASQPKNNAE